ncbi:MAG: radical SAM protein [Anaerolineales bacterium]|nr:radical SAM protein [Anaerolineales bacterium]
MNVVFGPVPSRRLGRSLGIDPIPLKTCNWNCVYCQLGRTTPLCNERRLYVPRETILEQLDQALSGPLKYEIDWITIIGSGEPTLHSELGQLILDIKQRTQIPVAVMTNGALLYRPRVRRELMAADAVIPSLDAGDPFLYRKINRPWPRLTFQRHVAGIRIFNQEYGGKLWVESMLIAGMNDSDQALFDLRDRLEEIEPDEIHINVPTRPPAETWVQPPPPERLERACQILGESSRIISKPARLADLSSLPRLKETILEIITRHPMTEEELGEVLPGCSREDIREAIASLQAAGEARQVDRLDRRFWSSAKARYPLH